MCKALLPAHGEDAEDSDEERVNVMRAAPRKDDVLLEWRTKCINRRKTFFFHITYVVTHSKMTPLIFLFIDTTGDGDTSESGAPS